MLATEKFWQAKDKWTVVYVDGEIKGPLKTSDVVHIIDRGSGRFEVKLGSIPDSEFYDRDTDTGALVLDDQESKFRAVIYALNSEFVISARIKTGSTIPEATGVWGGTG